MKYIQMDAKVMDFPEGSFDAILDKATLDSVLVFKYLKIVRVKLNCKCSKSHFISISSAFQEWSVHRGVLRTAIIQIDIFIKAIVLMDG